MAIILPLSYISIVYIVEYTISLYYLLYILGSPISKVVRIREVPHKRKKQQCTKSAGYTHSTFTPQLDSTKKWSLK